MNMMNKYEDQQKAIDGEGPTVDVIAEEEILRRRRIASNLRQLGGAERNFDVVVHGSPFLGNDIGGKKSE